ncbi:hypothetical protein BZZ01_31415 [Nostocales cyanobacterium HT-58-2]|nr:hypothetical protein BZZ01_31415 [Nostocales cyanobacterium HT-58-2]
MYLILAYSLVTFMVLNNNTLPLSFWLNSFALCDVFVSFNNTVEHSACALLELYAGNFIAIL